jgi:hypothetical protein
METLRDGPDIGIVKYVRFHLGSGINGNLLTVDPSVESPIEASPLSSRKWN